MQETGIGRNSKVLTESNSALAPRYRRYRGTFPRRKRIYPISIAEILRTLEAEECPIHLDTFLRLMLKENLFMMTRRGKRWICEPYEARLIVEIIKEWYGKKNLLSGPDPL